MKIFLYVAPSYRPRCCESQHRPQNIKYLKPPPSGKVETPTEIHHVFAQISVLGRFVQVRSHLSMDFFQTNVGFGMVGW